ncbi:5-(carboxyamino)imidazole ribonucleotide synthase [Roseobacter sp. N2S]|uniref:5-(carboxyamino)imidazole ribonucleotide synthase n=1 Tax=Roseobacter sp. N2S TaxID=2663844 RepID=UPI00286360CE|nr:5-(carboxyamino)imidazole ribonucleotide synthase [Roseobacter sp. N2S]MDR6265180.1 5-(carboxyamino)imidazole ribonucleotide synthase [Roseobacter sp. N2S]
MSNPLQTGATIGILGGGQLGRMLSVAASRLGFKTHIFELGANPPAGHVADQVTTAPYDDLDALRAFAQSVDVVTYEFENIPADALDAIEELRPVMPNRRALATSQDRIVEKDFLTSLGLKCAPYANVETADDLIAAVAAVGVPSILKTRRFGYDGKGQVRLKDSTNPTSAWQELGETPSVLEGFIEFSHEVSVIGARSQDGAVVCFDPGENVHTDGILHTTTLPAHLNRSQHTDAIILTGQILNALDYVGVMGVELFVTPQGLIVNEIAPRVHNSGHWTQNGCVIDQFEQHIRAIAGWPLGDGKRHSNVVMTNLIGAAVNDVAALSQDSSVGLHLYGKAEAKAGRKMGHVNKIMGPA